MRGVGYPGQGLHGWPRAGCDMPNGRHSNWFKFPSASVARYVLNPSGSIDSRVQAPGAYCRLNDLSMSAKSPLVLDGKVTQP